MFLVFCGVVGLGRLAARDAKLFEQLRPYASDPRWRIREALATELQLAGDQNMDLVLKEMKKWQTNFNRYSNNSNYFMPVYMYPGLLKGVSSELKKRMQGKSCFNFRKVEPQLFAELAELTRRGAKKFKEENTA